MRVRSDGQPENCTIQIMNLQDFDYKEMPVTLLSATYYKQDTVTA